VNENDLKIRKEKSPYSIKCKILSKGTNFTFGVFRLGIDDTANTAMA
jgi:hypothetical protein